MNEDNAQPVVEESQTQPPVEQVEATPTTPAEVGNESDVNDEPAADNAVIEGADAPQATAPETPAPVANDDDPEDANLSNFQVQPPPTVDIQQYIDENGNLDLASYQTAQAQAQAAIVQAAVQQTRAERAYEKTWDKAYEAHPELKSDRELRDMVQAIHANSPQTGKYLSPKQAADKLFGIAGQAKQAGIKAAQEMRTVQAAANLGQSAPAASPQGGGTKLAELKDQMMNGNTLAERKAGSAGYLEELVKSGAL